MSPELFELVAVSMIADIFREAEANTWLRRAEEFERCKPVVGEFHGQADSARLSAQWRRADETARACRNRASVCEAGEWRDLLAADIRDLDAARWMVAAARPHELGEVA